MQKGKKMEKKEYCSNVTAVSMLVGSVVGSGVFFKAETINYITNGNIIQGSFAWLMGGMIMIVCLLNFSVICAKHSVDDGLCGFAGETVGKRYSYYVGWFMMCIYYPSMVSVLSEMSAVYAMAFWGVKDFAGEMRLALSLAFMIASFGLNTFSQVLSEKFQLITTGMKLLPLILIIIYGLIKGAGAEMQAINHFENEKGAFSFFSAVTACAFAYEGWINATNISSRLKNGRKSLPGVLITGGIIVFVIYVLYYIGVSIAAGEGNAANIPKGMVARAYRNVLGDKGGSILLGFVAISCLGALNAMVYGCIRAKQHLSAQKVKYSFMKPQKNEKYTVLKLAVIGFLISFMWLLFNYRANTAPHSIAGRIFFESSELPVVTAYIIYIPIFLAFAKKNTSERRVPEKALAYCGAAACILMILSAICAHGSELINYLSVLMAIMFAGAVFEKN